MIERHELTVTVRVEWWHEYRLTPDGLLQTLNSQYPDFEFTVKELTASPCKPHIMRGRQSDYFIIATILGFYKKDIPKEVFDNLCNELIAALA